MKNVSVTKGEGHYLTCYEESLKHNPSEIVWNFGKDLGSLKEIQLKEWVYDYSVDVISEDQAGFYSCKFLGGSRNGWEKFFHLTVKPGKCFIALNSLI